MKFTKPVLIQMILTPKEIEIMANVLSDISPIRNGSQVIEPTVENMIGISINRKFYQSLVDGKELE